jgi:hypothetical protein
MTKFFPHNPQHNGNAERMNSTLGEPVHCMIHYSQLPSESEGHCFLTAIYLRNRIFTRTLGNKIPFEAWFGQQPGLGHLRVFGCTVFAHNDVAIRAKNSQKAFKCILLGYGDDFNGLNGCKLL